MGASWCDPSSIKQIAGRAGRLSSAYKVGEVTAWQVRRFRERAGRERDVMLSLGVVRGSGYSI